MRISHILLASCLCFSSVAFAQKGKKDFSQPSNAKSIAPVQVPDDPVNIYDKRRVRDNSQSSEPKSFSFPGTVVNKNPLSALRITQDNGAPIFITGGLGKGQAPREAANNYLSQIGSSIGINDPANELRITSVETDALGKVHYKYQQKYNGADVFGSQLYVHIEGNEVYLMNGRFYPTPELESMVPGITDKTAEGIALHHIAKTHEIHDLSEVDHHIVDYDGPVTTLVVYHKDNNPDLETLAWHVEVRPNMVEVFEYFIDANSGAIIHEYNNTCSDGPFTANETDLNGQTQTINTYQVGATYYMIDGSKSMFNLGSSTLPDDPVGAIWTIDAQNTESSNLNVVHVTSGTNVWNNATAVSAHYHASEAFDYFQNTHGRNSINGQGGTIISVINVGTNFDNAYWNGQAMFYGNGGSAFDPLAGSLDVAGHEMTHGVISNSANLVYENQSGALNESFADIFGAMMDRSDWLIGEDITKTSFIPTGALRDMQNPNQGGSSLSDPGYQPDHMNDIYTGTADNGGVHINSGINNKAYYLFATATSQDTAEDVYYRALTNYLTASSQFIDCRLAVIQSATDLYGAASNPVAQAAIAYDAVGILDGSGSTGDTTLPVNNGTESLLSVDINPGDPNTLYRSTTAGTGFVALSQTGFLNKANVVDNGSECVFVADDRTIHYMNPENTGTEIVLQSQTIWYNAALSRDGSKMAAVQYDNDSAIWVYDFNLTTWQKFHLYSPTFTEGVQGDEVVYADALDWDESGEYVLYDAYNEIENSGGDNITYWDIGFIRVWNNTTDSYGDGTITKLFSSLPADVNVGNPVFSKNDPNIIAFDYIHSPSSTAEVWGADIETGDIGTIAVNNTWGYPTYSTNDDKVAFVSYNGSNDEVSVISLQADKINSTGSATTIIGLATYPVWYANGSRITGTEADQALTEGSLVVYPNPAEDVLRLDFQIASGADAVYTIFDVLGKKRFELATTYNQVGAYSQVIDVSDLESGNYVIKVNIGAATFSKRLLIVK